MLCPINIIRILAVGSLRKSFVLEKKLNNFKLQISLDVVVHPLLFCGNKNLPEFKR
jgi:hypothetical protein